MQRVRLRLVLSLLFVLAPLLQLSPASAQPPPEAKPVYVVDVRARATELDAEKLRAAIGAELKGDAVAPGDPRAHDAQGVLTLDIDHKDQKLVVTYLATAEPVTRRVALPADAALTARAAVLLAGNLARNEAGELAEELRRQRPSATTPYAWDDAPIAEQVVDVNAQRSVDSRLQATLDYNARQEGGLRIGLLSTALLSGVALTAGPLFLRPQPSPFWPWLAVSAFGPILVIESAIAFGAPFSTPFGDLAGYSRIGAGPVTTEERWAQLAQSEHSRRRVGGIVALVLCGLTLGAGVFVSFDTGDFSDALTRSGLATTLLGLSTIHGFLAIYELKTDGPLESGLRAYELSTGRSAKPKEESVLEHLRVSFVQGGAVAGFGASF